MTAGRDFTRCLKNFFPVDDSAGFSVYGGGDVLDILQTLADIEARENVRIIYAVESGSRAWGFASPDSDFDIRFIYVRPIEDYLRLEGIADFIDWQRNKLLDANGWDLKKTLRQFFKSNATLFEWTNSPIVYKTTPDWDSISAVGQKFFSPQATFDAYSGFAKKMGSALLKRDSVSPKKYLYALRTIFCRNYVAEKLCPPPVAFEKLSLEMSPENLREDIFTLIARKTSAETSKIKIPVLDEYISAELKREKSLKKILPPTTPRSIKELEKIFVRCLRGELR